MQRTTRRFWHAASLAVSIDLVAGALLWIALFVLKEVAKEEGWSPLLRWCQNYHHVTALALTMVFVICHVWLSLYKFAEDQEALHLMCQKTSIEENKRVVEPTPENELNTELLLVERLKGEDLWCFMTDPDDGDEIFCPGASVYLVMVQEGKTPHIGPIERPRFDGGEGDDEQSVILDDVLLYSACAYRDADDGPELHSYVFTYFPTKARIELVELVIGAVIDVGPVTLIVRASLEDAVTDRAMIRFGEGWIGKQRAPAVTERVVREVKAEEDEDDEQE